jgi:hypothetical protein
LNGQIIDPRSSRGRAELKNCRLAVDRCWIVTIRPWHLVLALVLAVACGGAVVVVSKGHSGTAAGSGGIKTSSASPEQVVSSFYSTRSAATECQLESDRMLQFYYDLDQSTPNPTVASGPMDFCIQDEKRTLRVGERPPP